MRLSLANSGRGKNSERSPNRRSKPVLRFFLAHLYPLGSWVPEARLQDKDSSMDCQGVQEKPEERPRGQYNLKVARGSPSYLFYFPLVLGAFLLALPGLPGNSSSSPILRPP